MPPTRAVHPSPETLAAFGRGQLDPPAQEEIERHVAECDSCCEALRQVPDDSLLDRLRQARAAQQTNTADTQAEPRSPQGPEGLPPELVSHPRYRIVQQLGKGGMGVVYKAEHRLMERTVALKVISRELLSSANAVERFEREVKAAARLQHPNIVLAHDAERAGDYHFLVMEYVEGINLARLVEKRGALAIPHACHFMRQTALGLQHAHEQGMVHRDIKPHNLMVTRKGQLKILDFGLARLFDRAGQKDETRALAKGLTAIDVVVGTPDYLSPEQARNSQAIDVRSDLYSLGCTFYFLLIGRPPFSGSSAMEKLFLHCEADPTAIEELRPEVPAEVCEVVQRLMAKRPEDRYQTAAEVAAALTALVRGNATPGASLFSPLQALAEGPEVITPSPDEPAGRETDEAKSSSRMMLHRPAAPKRKKARRPRKSLTLPWKPALLALGLLLLVLGVMMVVGAIRKDREPEGSTQKIGPGRGSTVSPRAGRPRVLFLLPSQNFWYPDYGPVREELERGGVEVVVASTIKQAQPHPDGGGSRVLVNVRLDAVSPDNFDALVIGGGPGVAEFVQTAAAGTAHNLIHRMRAAGKPVSALCMGPLVLAAAGVLKGKRVTCRSDDKSAEWIRKKGGVVDTSQGVVEVEESGLGPIITGKDQWVARDFAGAVLRAIERTRGRSR